LSFRFLQDKVRTDLARILPEMALTRFAAVQWLSAVVVACVALYLLSPILTPFVAAGIIAYICNPTVRRLTEWKLPRTLAVILVMSSLLLLFALLVLIVLPLLETSASQLLEHIPRWFDAVRLHMLPLLQRWFGADLQWDSATLKDIALGHWRSAGNVLKTLLPLLGSGGGAIFGMLLNLLLIPVAMFYMLCDWDNWLAHAEELIPRHLHPAAKGIIVEVDRVMAEFLRGQMSVMLLMSIYYVLALWLVGLQFALPIGIIAGMLVFIPYLGMITGLVLATLAGLTQFGELGSVVLVWAVFGAGQLLEGMVVTPRLVGERIGLHPLAVIFALMAFGQLFGFFGLLLALPLSAICLVALRYGKAWYLSSTMYRKP
jgi:predicted PurR-regulated permease PerM